MEVGTLYPFGYLVPNALEALDALMAQPRTVLVDIRYSARSRRPEWNAAQLVQRYGHQYKPLSCLGNENYQNGGPIKLSAPDIGIPTLIDGLKKGYTLILLCGCKDYERCHRRTVVDLVAAAMPSVKIEGIAAPTPEPLTQMSLAQFWQQPPTVQAQMRDQIAHGSAQPSRCITTVTQEGATFARVLNRPGTQKQGTMKALSIRQPWTWLIANGHKDIENRDWPTSYRGQVLLHAGKAFDTDFPWSRFDTAERKMPLPRDYPLGGIVGVATLMDVVTSSASPWFVGHYGFVLKDACPLPFIPLRGQLGLFDVPTEIMQLHEMI